jgi:putative redox protein
MTTTVSVTLKHDLHFEGVTDTGKEFVIPLDSRASASEIPEGIPPVKLVLVSLAGCAGMDVLSILRKKRQQVTGFEVRIDADRATEHPKVYTDIRMTFLVTGHEVDPQAIERSIELTMTKYCSVAALLQKAVPIHTHYEIVEAEVTAEVV